jgi:uncharacterized Zn-binding protein involved in type VI secretion
MATILSVGCPSDHGGMVITGDPTALIDGKPVARIGDQHSCPQSYPDGQPHSVTPIFPGSPCSNRPTVNGIPMALSGDVTQCGAQMLPCGINANVQC